MRFHSLLTTLLLLSTSSAFGSIVLIGEVPLSGTGFGSVPTILTIQDQSSGPGDLTGTGVSSGCVAPGTPQDVKGSAACPSGFGLLGGEEKPGGLTQTRLLSDPMIVDLGITSLANVGIIYNSANQGNNEDVNLQQLVLTIYDGLNPIYSAGLAAPVTLTGFTGSGKSGYLFALDDIQLAEAIDQTTGLNFGDLRIGLGATVSNDFGGNETFFVGYYDRLSNEPGEVPEPASMVLGGVGLLAGAIAKFRRASRS